MPTFLDYGDRGRVQIVADGQALARSAAELVQQVITTAVAERGQAYIALSGGSTPKAMGAILREEPFRTSIPWSDVQIFWGDERSVPIGDPENNAGEAIRGYLDSLPVPPANIHPFDTSLDPDSSASHYAAVISQIVPGEPHPVFDLVLLGMGDDGHTASLFPQTPALAITDRLVVSNWVEKLNTTRLTFTWPLINASRTVAFLAGGAGKADRLFDVLDGDLDTDRLPSQLIRPTSADLRWIVDEPAAARLSRRTQ